MDSVRDKVAVITGAASGVGLALAKTLAREGAHLVLADIEDGALKTAAEAVKAGGAKVVVQTTDVVKRDQVERLAGKAYEAFGRVDMLFNNAGVGGGARGSLWETSEKSFRWTMDVNFFGPLHGIQVFLPKMVAQGGGGLITATSSGAGLIFPPTSPGYSASKAALIALMEVLSFQLAGKHPEIKAAILFPGPHVVDTRLVSSARNVQAEYADSAVTATAGPAGGTFREVMGKVAGFDIPFTEPEEFAEETLQSILRGDFYILPLTDKTKAAIRKRTEDLVERRQPTVPDMF